MTRRADSQCKAAVHAVAVVVAIVIATVASGCQTLESYGRAYQRSNDAVPGVPAAPALIEQQARAADARAAVFGAPQAQELVRCERLRAQLAHASRAATMHTACVWGCPLAWPVGIVSALVWPIHETRTAQAVWRAAEDLERAYQSDTESFLATCRQVSDGEVGRAFAQVFIAPSSSSSSSVPSSTP